MATRPPATMSVALLWDLDNVSVPRQDMDSFARKPRGLVKPEAAGVAAVHRRMFRVSRNTLPAHSIQAVCGGRDPDGADGALRRQAGRPRNRGFARFRLVTNDHLVGRSAASAEVRAH